MRDVADIQRKLIALGFLPEHDAIGGPNVDGRFGGRTLEAANAYLTAIGAPRMVPPITKTHIAELLRLLFPEEYAKPAPSPVQNWLIGLAIKQAVSALKGSPMSATLAGYKTYIIAAVLVIVAGLEAMGIQIPFVSSTPAELITYALGLIFARNGAKTEVAKVLGK